MIPTAKDTKAQTRAHEIEKVRNLIEKASKDGRMEAVVPHLLSPETKGILKRAGYEVTAEFSCFTGDTEVITWDCGTEEVVLITPDPEPVKGTTEESFLEEAREALTPILEKYGVTVDGGDCLYLEAEGSCIFLDRLIPEKFWKD